MAGEPPAAFPQTCVETCVGIRLLLPLREAGQPPDSSPAVRVLVRRTAGLSILPFSASLVVILFFF